MTDTIFALATPPGRGAVAVVRLSGPGAKEAVVAIAGVLPAPRQATLRTLRAAGGEVLDRALVLWFPGPASFTGENCAEFHLHGGAAVVDGLTLALLAEGLRLAGPGEFTRRAFENGKLDLGQAEAVADLVDAETSSQARQALDQLAGALSVKYGRWRETLIAAMSLLEAAVDFPEEDTASQIARSVAPELRELADELQRATADAQRGRHVREGYRMAIIGAPNAGKSSLINRLTERAVAIVAPRPGTTRDLIEAPLTIAGYRVLAIDTAGIRQSEDAVEAEGAQRAAETARDAALRLWVVDGSANTGDWKAAADFLRAGDLSVINKSDLPSGADAVNATAHARATGAEPVFVSARSGDLTVIVEAIQTRVVSALSGADFPAATRVRHLSLLRDCSHNLGQALQDLDRPELAAEGLRLAARALQRVTGVIGVEDVLDRLFSTFCIGK